MKNYNQKEIFIIGNNNGGSPIADGGRIKIRFYYKLLCKEGFNPTIIDLFKWKRKILSIISKIINAVKKRATIIIMAGPNGSRFIIPFVNFFNKSHKSRVIFVMLGIGTLEEIIHSLNTDQINDFINCKNFFNIKDNYIKKHLNSLDKVIPQNKVIAEVYRHFYSLSNVEILNNFRDAEINEKQYSFANSLSIIFISRVCTEKGIFDLIDSIKQLNKKSFNIKLDIYGELQFNQQEHDTFFSLLDEFIVYKGIANYEDSISVIKQYDLFCLPTKYVGEGTPGSVIESFISGTPVLISSYNQALELIKNNENGFIFEQSNINSLTDTISYLYENKHLLEKVGLKAQELSKKYLFSYNKKQFFKIMLGDKK
ncbi:MAG: glycosyltransferase [Clostridia bacterium]|nr:glycosyltransferase [Clostridia bacterium]